MRLWVLTLGYGFALTLLFLVVNGVVSEWTGWLHPLPGVLSGGAAVAIVVLSLAWWSNRILTRRASTAAGRDGSLEGEAGVAPDPRRHNSSGE